MKKKKSLIGYVMPDVSAKDIKYVYAFGGIGTPHLPDIRKHKTSNFSKKIRITLEELK